MVVQRLKSHPREFVAFVAGAVALCATAIALILPSTALVAFDTAWTAGGACALSGLLAARHSADCETRGPWTWLCAGALSWTVGQLAWDAFAVVGTPGSPNLADLGWWGFAVLVVVGLLRGSGRRGGGRAVQYLETLPLVAAAMALTVALLWNHADRSPVSLSAQLSAFVYPALYVSAAVMTLQAIVAGTLRHARGSGVVLVLVGIVAQAMAFILWSGALLDDDYVVGQTAIDPLWVLGLLAIGGGSVTVGRAPAQEVAAEPGDRGVVLPAATFVALMGALVHAQLAAAPLGAMLSLSAGLTICGMTLVVRGVLLGRGQRLLLNQEREARQALIEREAQLQRLTEQLAEDARRDALTGLRNRRALAEDLLVVEQQAARRAGTYAVILCDVDHFKAYNDALGHLAGDDALRTLALLVRGDLRAGDAAYRYGGEELVVVLHDATIDDATLVADRIRQALARAAIAHPDGIDGVITVSIGIAAGCGDTEQLLLRADAALYRAKAEGRNRTATANEDGAMSAPPNVRDPEPAVTEPGVRQLNSLLAVARAARAADGPVAVLHALADVIRSELRFGTVVGNLRLPGGEQVRAEVVLGDHEAREQLLGTTTPWSDWEVMLAPENDRCGAVWLPAGSYDWNTGVPAWMPSASAHPAVDAWQREDALLLPLRDATGEILAVLAVDEPLSGRRPSDDAIEVLMAVANHGAAILEQLAPQGPEALATVPAHASRRSETVAVEPPTAGKSDLERVHLDVLSVRSAARDLERHR